VPGFIWSARVRARPSNPGSRPFVQSLCLSKNFYISQSIRSSKLNLITSLELQTATQSAPVLAEEVDLLSPTAITHSCTPLLPQPCLSPRKTASRASTRRPMPPALAHPSKPMVFPSRRPRKSRCALSAGRRWFAITRSRWRHTQTHIATPGLRRSAFRMISLLE